MKTITLWMPWFFLGYVDALLRPDLMRKHDLNNGPLPPTVSKQAHDDHRDSVVSRLLECPEDLHDSLEEPIIPNTRSVTCSRSSNCQVYGDCCWDVELLDSPEADLPKSSCLPVHAYPGAKAFVYMVTGCLSAWPEDEVREACEAIHAFNDTFHFIPATSAKDLTYRNAFCAICNYDIANATFWTPVTIANESAVYVFPPDMVRRNPTRHLRPCSEHRPKEACPEGTAEEVTRKCDMYYAPVKHENDAEEQLYKNVYCALCSGADVFNLTCTPTTFLPQTADGGMKISLGPNLAALFRPVVSTPTCYALHDGHCYITREKLVPSAQRHSENYADVVTETSAKRWSLVTYKPKKPDYYSLQNYITVVSTSLSICFLALKIVVFCTYSDARSASSSCTICLSATLLVTQALFLLTKGIDLSDDVCYAGAVFVHYSFLCTFFWTCVLSFDIWRSLTTVSANSTRNSSLATYGLFAWGAPIAVIAAALTVDQTAPESALSPSYGETACFICTFWGQVLYFQVPMASLVLFCLFMYLSTVCYIRNTSSAVQGTRGGSVSSKEGDAKDNQQRSCLGLYVSLALVMGFPWTVALVGAFVESTVIDTIVNVLVGSQGAYLFVIFKDYRYIWSSVRKGWKRAAPKPDA